MASYIGLDIGTMAVRAAEVTWHGDAPQLEHFGQVALPYGAVRNGEIADVGAVGEAIQRLWSQTGFRSKKVVVGMANQRVFVRQAELPAMSEEEIRNALAFEAQEFIPIPIDDVEMDFRVIESVTGPDGEPKVRILLAAAQKDMVHNLVSAAELAGLRVLKVDLIPFALVRALSGISLQLGGGDSHAEAIVSIGAGITNVVVHEQGVPRFVRILSMGGGTVTEAIAEQLEVDMDTAEELKRYSYMRPSDPRSAKVAEIVAAQVRPLLQEIQGSLHFYSSQADAAPLARVLVAGGGSLTPGLFDQLVAQSEAPVHPALLLGSIHLGRTGLSEQDLTRSEPVMAAPLGLALAPLDGASISLLPAHFAHRPNVMASALVGGVLVLIVLVAVFADWHSKGPTLTKLRNETAQAQQQAAHYKSLIPGASALNQLTQQNQAEVATVKGVLAGDVDWVTLLGEIAQAMPADTWVTSIQLSASAATATTAPTTATTAASSTSRSSPSGSSTSGSTTSPSASSIIGKASFSVEGVNFTSAAEWMEDFSTSNFPALDGMWLAAITESTVPDQWSPNSGSSSGGSSTGGSVPSTAPSGITGAAAGASSPTGFGASAPNPDPSAQLCIIPGHCTFSFTATASITGAAASQRVNCYATAAGFAASNCPTQDVTGAGS